MEFWDFVENFRKNLTNPCLFFVDMNGTLLASDQSCSGPSSSSTYGSRFLRKTTNSLGLVDLRALNGHYTWCNRRFSTVGGCS